MSIAWTRGSENSIGPTLRVLATVLISSYLDLIRNSANRKDLVKIRISNHKLMIETGRYNQTSRNDRLCPICNSGIIEDEFHFLFHCPKYSIPREKFYDQIQQNFVDFDQLSYTELIIKLMNSQNFSVNSHLLKFVSLCNDLRNNLLSSHADDTWLTTVIIALSLLWFVCLFVCLFLC